MRGKEQLLNIVEKSQLKPKLELAVNLIEELLGIKGVQATEHRITDEKDKTSIFYRFRLSQREAALLQLILVTDMDDTLSPYTKFKKDYHDSLVGRFLLALPEKTRVSASQLRDFFSLVNRVARVFPADGTHPEMYAPYLEVLMESVLWDLIGDPKKFDNILGLDEAAIRQFILKEVAIDSFNLVTEEKIKDGQAISKDYLQIKNAFDVDSIRKIVNTDILELFLQATVRAQLDIESLQNLKVTEDNYWVIATFGGLHFQLNKVLTLLMQLQQADMRMPDEILILIQGRKDSMLEDLLNRLNLSEQFKPIFVYLDDSLRQLKAVKEKLKDRVIGFFLQATQPQAKRAEEVEEREGADLVDLSKQSIGGLLASLFSKS